MRELSEHKITGLDLEMIFYNGQIQVTFRPEGAFEDTEELFLARAMKQAKTVWALHKQMEHHEPYF